ncbi:DUF5667 domain-containing protein [Actinoplanes sp. GCM10030250]|uniref:DUF5667 domain-containing protein n=1 Tax=Actinoplanes sp. GCM10030250 TaxID=3273376 RepID=UPI00361EACBF
MAPQLPNFSGHRRGRRATRFAALTDRDAPLLHSVDGDDPHLEQLVEVTRDLATSAPAISIDAEFKNGLRAMLAATAERDGIGRTADGGGGLEPVVDPADGKTPRPIFGRRIRARGAIVIGVAAGAMAVSGISAASENASPGDALYSVKRSTERAQLAIAGSDVSRGQLSLDFAKNRLAEAVAMDGADSSFGTVLDDMDADTRRGVRLLTSSVAEKRDPRPLGTLDSFVTAQEQQLEPALPDLAQTNRHRAATSLKLLTTIRERIENLESGLSCKSAAPTEPDELGAKLGDCTAETKSRPAASPGTPGD